MNEHLIELRNRIIRAVIYIIVGFTVAFAYYNSLFKVISFPIKPILDASGGKFLITGIAEGFMLKLEICFVSGIALMSPFIVIELIFFLLPAFTKKEKKIVFAFIIPIFLLFLCGVTFCYFILPRAINFLVSQNPIGVIFLPNVKESLLFVVRTALFGGLSFELPVVITILALLEVVDYKLLTEKWRHVIVSIAIFSALITPTVDAFSMILMSLPLLILYILSIAIVYIIEKKRKNEEPC